MTHEDRDPSLTRLLNAHPLPQPSSGAAPEIEALYAQCRAVVKRVKSRSLGFGGLDTTDLLHRAWERTLLVQGQTAPAERWNSREHFFATLAKATVESIIDERRWRDADKRGGGARPSPIDELPEPAADRRRPTEAPWIEGDDRRALRQALDEFASIDPRACTVVVLRSFWAFSAGDVALSLGISERSVNRDWRAARAWLARRICEIQGIPLAAGLHRDPEGDAGPDAGDR
jgi:RNA polymerase sigma factor (TIGR02999 family)